jgi:hypothetical protein
VAKVANPARKMQMQRTWNKKVLRGAIVDCGSDSAFILSLHHGRFAASDQLNITNRTLSPILVKFTFE